MGLEERNSENEEEGENGIIKLYDTIYELSNKERSVLMAFLVNGPSTPYKILEVIEERLKDEKISRSFVYNIVRKLASKGFLKEIQKEKMPSGLTKRVYGATLLGLYAGLVLSSGDVSYYILENSHLLPDLSEFWKVLKSLEIEEDLVGSLEKAIEDLIEEEVEKIDDPTHLEIEENRVIDRFIKYVILDHVFYDIIFLDKGERFNVFGKLLEALKQSDLRIPFKEKFGEALKDAKDGLKELLNIYSTM